MKQRRWWFGTAIRTWTLHMTTCCRDSTFFKTFRVKGYSRRWMYQMDWSPGAITRTYVSPSRNHILWTPCICTYLWVVGGHPTDLILSRLVGHPFFWRLDLRLPSRKSSSLNLRNSWMKRWEILSHATAPIVPVGPMFPKRNRNAKVQNLRLWENGWSEGVMVEGNPKHGLCWRHSELGEVYNMFLF